MSVLSVIAKRFFPSLPVLFCLVAFAGCAQARVEIRDAWIAEAPPNVMAQAGYLTLENATDRRVTLVSVQSDAFETVQIHQSKNNKSMGMMTMEHAPRVEIPPHETLRFAPGGYHLMLMKPRRRLKAGEQVTVTLRFADGATFHIAFTVRRERFAL